MPLHDAFITYQKSHMASPKDWNDWASNGQLQMPHASHTPISLPNYIKTPHSLHQNDLQYLSQEGAFNIPDTSLKNALLLSYINHVHQSLPLINIHRLLETTCAITARRNLREDQKMSLILFQAIMFAGSGFVDQISLQMAGYNTRREARAILYQKVKLLYESNYEVDDQLAIVQSLLLMTYWHEVPLDGKDEWYWLGIAISITTSIPNRAAIVELRPRDQKVWNRVWWCCFTRDRLLSFGLRRRPRIEEDDGHSFTTPTITLDDFEIERLDTDVLAIPLADCRVVKDTSLQLQLAKTFMAKAELCVCIGHILKTQYHFTIRDNVGFEASNMSRAALVPRLETAGFASCADELAQWLRSLQPGVLHTPLTADRIAIDGTSLVIEKAVLHTVFLAIFSTLHRPRALSPLHDDSQITSRRVIRDAATEITKIYMDLYNLNLVRFLPTTAVTVLLPAIISHIQTIKISKNGDPVWEEAMTGLTQCMQILKKLRDNNRPAEESIYLLEQALKHADIQVMTEVPSPASSNTNIPTREGYSPKESDAPPSNVEADTFDYQQVPSPSGASRRYANASMTFNINDHDFQAIDPAVSILSQELAWLDDAFAGSV